MIEFNWIQLNHDCLYEIMYEIAPNVQDKLLSPKQFHRIAANNIRKHLPITVCMKYNPIVPPKMIFIGGAYYPTADENGEKCIEINFNYDLTNTLLLINNKRFNRFCLLFADTMLHEIIHMRQYRGRYHEANHSYPSQVKNKKKRDEQSYLGNLDEIEAYAFNIACELLRRYNGNQQRAIEHLDLGYRRIKDNYSKYLKTFDKNQNHQVIIKLKKMIIFFIPRAANIKKPYFRSNLLNC